MPAALIIDLKDSRQYDSERRGAIQSYLIKVVDELNRIFKPALEREMRFSGGDELQGLFSNATGAYLCLRLFHRVVYPLRIHAGIGVGEWTTVVRERDTFYQDGPVYHNARYAVDNAKRETDYTAVLTTGKGWDAQWNAMLNVSLQTAERNTRLQNEMTVLMEIVYPLGRSGDADYSDMTGLWGLVMQREQYMLFENNRGRSLRLDDTAVLAGPKEKQPSFDDYDIIYKYAHPYRAASRIAELVGQSRQSVDMTLRTSGVYAERAVALGLMDVFNHEEYGLYRRRF